MSPGFLSGSLSTSATNTLSSLSKPLRLELEFKGKSGSTSTPKHGKVDPDNTPHVGGNTWAGGTGGRDTAGLGGRGNVRNGVSNSHSGGPYRLDAGHDVHQLSDEEKRNVDEATLRVCNSTDPIVYTVQKAREMGREAFKDRLKEIEMSEYDCEYYDRFLDRVKTQIYQLRVILEGLQAKKKNER